MYGNLGYKVFRTIENYYAGADDDEDALDMRKALSRDKKKISEEPCTNPDFPLEA
jgi:N-terminal acetyltransferase B complex catalytic subunit